MKRTLLASVAAILTLAAAFGIFQTRFQNIGNAHAVNAPVTIAAAPGKPIPEASIVDQDAPYYEACAREGLNESECVGRLIWFKAAAGNDRFHR